MEKASKSLMDTNNPVNKSVRSFYDEISAWFKNSIPFF
jgi:hypothetical protein